jgi:hypothetical protein
LPKANFQQKGNKQRRRSSVGMGAFGDLQSFCRGASSFTRGRVGGVGGGGGDSFIRRWQQRNHQASPCGLRPQFAADEGEVGERGDGGGAGATPTAGAGPGSYPASSVLGVGSVLGTAADQHIDGRQVQAQALAPGPASASGLGDFQLELKRTLLELMREIGIVKEQQSQLYLQMQRIQQPPARQHGRKNVMAARKPAQQQQQPQQQQQQQQQPTPSKEAATAHGLHEALSRELPPLPDSEGLQRAGPLQSTPSASSVHDTESFQQTRGKETKSRPPRSAHFVSCSVLSTTAPLPGSAGTIDSESMEA